VEKFGFRVGVTFLGAVEGPRKGSKNKEEWRKKKGKEALKEKSTNQLEGICEIKKGVGFRIRCPPGERHARGEMILEKSGMCFERTGSRKKLHGETRAEGHCVGGKNIAKGPGLFGGGRKRVTGGRWGFSKKKT